MRWRHTGTSSTRVSDSLVRGCTWPLLLGGCGTRQGWEAGLGGRPRRVWAAFEHCSRAQCSSAAPSWQGLPAAGRGCCSRPVRLLASPALRRCPALPAWPRSQEAAGAEQPAAPAVLRPAGHGQDLHDPGHCAPDLRPCHGRHDPGAQRVGCAGGGGWVGGYWGRGVCGWCGRCQAAAVQGGRWLRARALARPECRRHCTQHRPVTPPHRRPWHQCGAQRDPGLRQHPHHLLQPVQAHHPGRVRRHDQGRTVCAAPRCAGGGGVVGGALVGWRGGPSECAAGPETREHLPCVASPTPTYPLPPTP